MHKLFRHLVDGLLYNLNYNFLGDQFFHISVEQVNGLFVSALTASSYTIEWPPYGDYKHVMDAEQLPGPDHRLYFADFYCNTSFIPNPTLVITKRGSGTDRICEEQLVELDKRDNPFLTCVLDNDDNTVYKIICL